jgi:CRISPR-associated endonuclease Csn1
MKKIIGLDLGTNSIGWALIEQNFDEKTGNIIGMGTRVIPMSQDILGEFDKGNSVSQTAERTRYRSTRRLRERHLLRRERLHRVLNILGFLPNHFADQIDFENRLGQFKTESEPKLAYNDKNFIFQNSFNEMLEDFKNHQPELLNRLNKKGESSKIPYDWTIYYLRKKALTKKIEKEELAWILLNFNQKRGYYQLRGEEEEENPNKRVAFYSLKVVDVKADDRQKGKDDIWYSLVLENGWVYRRSSKTPLFDWKDKLRDFIVTTDLNDDGSVKTDKDGNEKRSFRAPGENDWTLLKKKTEQEINQSHKTVGTYIYDTLLQNPNQKIKGKLVRTIERKYYKDELKSILLKQIELHPELKNESLFVDCVRELYRNNENHQNTLSGKSFLHLFIDDIIFFQRPLRSQKSSIGNCSLEKRKYKDSNGNEQVVAIKAIPKSNPVYQEFRIWKWMSDLSIYRRDDDTNVTNQFFQSHEGYEKLFDELNSRKEIKQEALLKYLVEQAGLKGKAASTEAAKYRWNFVEDKIYPLNETGAMINSRLEKVEKLSKNFLTKEKEHQLWHIIYSITDKIEFEKALKSFARKHKLDENSFAEIFKKFPPFKSEYASYSEKAIKKLLPLMRLGKYWSWEGIDFQTQNRIEKIIHGEYDEHISDRVREKAKTLTEQHHFQALPDWLAKYVVYGRHSEASNADKWNTPDDLKKYLKEFRQHSLRNPIVEQVVTETLRVVNDIWQHYGKGAQDFFDEIHVELGREMKNTAEDRKKITEKILGNESTNLRLKALLVEMLQQGDAENVRPYSPTQLEILKIYEDGVLNSNIEVPDDILKISKTAQPDSKDLLKYKLWLEQKYRSPYTGQIIPLNKLFTTDYEIEHIIPQSRYFDDSFGNKVICEAAINKLKDKQLGLEFIKNHHGEKIETGFGNVVTVFEEEAYQDFVKEHYAKSRNKKTNLLLDEVPERMIERQLNDTRYISKFISSVLSNIVRSGKDDDGVNSKNLIPGSGKITTQLKQDWGLNDVWNELILPRFERMNELTQSKAFTAYSKNHQKHLPTVPLEFSKGFQKKRIDHRHHALDALVIACATRSHVNFLNNQHALSKNKTEDEKQKSREDLKRVLCFKSKADANGNYQWVFSKPWDSFTVDAKFKLETIVVSFKQNLRVINKATNKYEKWVEKNGTKTKALVQQTKGDSWAIRKSMHQDTVAGLVKLRKKKDTTLNTAIDEPRNIVNKSLKKEILNRMAEKQDKKDIVKYFKELGQWEGQPLSKIEMYYWEVDEKGQGINAASRVKLDDTFDEKRIGCITDTGIQKILLNHLAKYKGRTDENGREIIPETLAFSAEGIEDMNKNLVDLNNGKHHKPILKVRTYEPKGNKFNVGSTGNKKDKFVIAAKGTNLFFAVYWDEDKKKRNYETIPLNEVIEHQKWRATLSKEEQKQIPMIPVKPENGKFLFSLSPNDLVYVPENGEAINADSLNPGNIYKVVSFTGNRLYAIPYYVASSIVDKAEFTQLNKLEFTLSKSSIKEFCIKLELNRLGNITKMAQHFKS